MGLTWTIDKQRRLSALYDKHKGTALERFVINVERSVHTLYDREDYMFWSVVKQRNKENNAIYLRRTRINKYMYGMYDTFVDVNYASPWFSYSPALFMVTLTFTDEHLANMSYNTLKYHVTHFLNTNTLDYIACVDFGSKRGRIHFHAVCALSADSRCVVVNAGKTFIQFKDAWPYGFHNITTIRGFKRAYKYAFKASDYAFKNATSDYKPFHKRGVAHVRVVRSGDWRGGLWLERVIDNHFFSCQQSSGFEVSRRLTPYQSPMLWLTETTLTNIPIDNQLKVTL